MTIELTYDGFSLFGGFKWENTRAGHESTVGGVSCGNKGCPASTGGNQADRITMTIDGGPEMDVEWMKTSFPSSCKLVAPG